ncbi:UvrD-helicase domain-containing protein [Shewanella baltica]|uniref:UvrD-helicase domain-containing protein n=1 Tax=Shewanella baltica TaxID=62322 RepID=UPI0030D0690A
MPSYAKPIEFKSNKITAKDAPVQSFENKLTPPKRNFSNLKAKFNVRNPTIEQQQALDLCDDGILVNSFAGTGKTTFSGQVAEKLGYEKTLYAAFLRENVSEAKERVTKQAYTQDALAFHFALKQSPFINSLDPKLSKKQSDAGALQMLLGLPTKLDLGGKIVKYYVLSMLIQETVNNFCCSVESEVSTIHVPKQVLSSQATQQIMLWARAYWEFLISRQNHDKHIIKFPHLMKFWAMRPDIQLPQKYANIIVDEAQDTNGAFYQVMKNHIDRNFVVIGDRHQQLFRWRGAVNTMNMFELPNKALTISHRFGESIAEVANNVLAKHSEPPKEIIRGNQNLDSKIVYYQPNEAFPNDVGAIITRTRTEIISIAKSELEQGHAISVKTEFGSIRFLCQNIMALAHNKTEQLRHPMIARCYSLSNLETELESSPDGDVYFALKLYKKFGDEILQIIDQVERLNQPESESTRLISTTHALKGREWDTIVISSDYLYLVDSPNVQLDDELCILYVAITRAKKKAYIPYGLKPYFENVGKGEVGKL